MTDEQVESPIANSYTRPWLVRDGEHIYMNAVGVFRIMIEADVARVILKGYFYESREFTNLIEVEDGVSIELVFGKVGNPSDYSTGNIWMRFNDCKRRRMWVGCPSALTPDEVCWIEVFVEFESNHWDIFDITEEDIDKSLHAPLPASSKERRVGDSKGRRGISQVRTPDGRRISE